MRLLVTNDDGIDSVFLHELVRALLAAGHEIFVAAPRHEQSWVGAAKSRNRPVHSTPANKGLGCATWVVDGTPSDCVNIAIDHLLPRSASGGQLVEGVVSGINVGLNASLGFIIASGTVAGAWEGALHGLPAIALSQDVTVETYDRLKSTGGVPDDELAATLRTSAAHAARLAPGLLAATPPAVSSSTTSTFRSRARPMRRCAGPFPPTSLCRGFSARRRTTGRTASSSGWGMMFPRPASSPIGSRLLPAGSATPSSITPVSGSNDHRSPKPHSDLPDV